MTQAQKGAKVIKKLYYAIEVNAFVGNGFFGIFWNFQILHNMAIKQRFLSVMYIYSTSFYVLG